MFTTLADATFKRLTTEHFWQTKASCVELLCSQIAIKISGKLEKLTMLSLRENRISELPLEIGNLSSLHVMDISGRLPLTFCCLVKPHKCLDMPRRSSRLFQSPSLRILIECRWIMFSHLPSREPLEEPAYLDGLPPPQGSVARREPKSTFA